MAARRKQTEKARSTTATGSMPPPCPTAPAMRLEDLTAGSSVRGILPDAAVTVVSVQWHGGDALTLVYREALGHPRS